MASPVVRLAFCTLIVAAGCSDDASTRSTTSPSQSSAALTSQTQLAPTQPASPTSSESPTSIESFPGPIVIGRADVEPCRDVVPANATIEPFSRTSNVTIRVEGESPPVYSDWVEVFVKRPDADCWKYAGILTAEGAFQPVLSDEWLPNEVPEGVDGVATARVVDPTLLGGWGFLVCLQTASRSEPGLSSMCAVARPS